MPYYTYCRNSLLEQLSYSVRLPRERGLLATCAWSPPDFTPHLSFCWSAVCPFAVINKSPEYNYLLSPPGESLILGAVLGTWTCPGVSNCFSTICQEACLFPLELSCHLCPNQSTTNVWIYFRFYSVLLKPRPPCTDCCGFIVSFKSRWRTSSNFVLFQNYFIILGLLHFHVIFRISMSIFTKKYTGFWLQFCHVDRKPLAEKWQ